MQNNDSPDSLQVSGAPAAKSSLTVNNGSLAIIALMLAGMNFIGLAWALDKANRAETRADLLQLEVESFKNVLHAARLPTAAHLPGESP